MNISEEDEEVHGNAPPVRSVVNAALAKMLREESLLVSLVQAQAPPPRHARLRLNMILTNFFSSKLVLPHLGLLLDEVL